MEYSQVGVVVPYTGISPPRRPQHSPPPNNGANWASVEPLSVLLGQDSGEFLVHLSHLLPDRALLLVTQDAISPVALLSPCGHRDHLLLPQHLPLSLAAPAVLKAGDLLSKPRQDRLPPPHSVVVQAGLCRWRDRCAARLNSTGRKGLQPNHVRQPRLRESRQHAPSGPRQHARRSASWAPRSPAAESRLAGVKSGQGTSPPPLSFLGVKTNRQAQGQAHGWRPSCDLKFRTRQEAARREEAPPDPSGVLDVSGAPSAAQKGPTTPPRRIGGWGWGGGWCACKRELAPPLTEASRRAHRHSQGDQPKA